MCNCCPSAKWWKLIIGTDPRDCEENKKSDILDSSSLHVSQLCKILNTIHFLKYYMYFELFYYHEHKTGFQWQSVKIKIYVCTCILLFFSENHHGNITEHKSKMFLTFFLLCFATFLTLQQTSLTMCFCIYEKSHFSLYKFHLNTFNTLPVRTIHFQAISQGIFISDKTESRIDPIQFLS